jgi:hypothetical protein
MSPNPDEHDTIAIMAGCFWLEARSCDVRGFWVATTAVVPRRRREDAPLCWLRRLWCGRGAHEPVNRLLGFDTGGSALQVTQQRCSEPEQARSSST